MHASRAREIANDYKYRLKTEQYLKQLFVIIEEAAQLGYHNREVVLPDDLDIHVIERVREMLEKQYGYVVRLTSKGGPDAPCFIDRGIQHFKKSFSYYISWDV